MLIEAPCTKVQGIFQARKGFICCSSLANPRGKLRGKRSLILFNYPAMGDSIDPGVFFSRADGKGHTTALIIVIVAVVGMNRHIQQIIPFYQMNLLELDLDLTGFLKGRQTHLIEVGVGPIATGPFPVKNTYAENAIQSGTINLKIHLHQYILSVLKDVSFLPPAVTETDPDNFDVSVPPPVFGNQSFCSAGGCFCLFF